MGETRTTVTTTETHKYTITTTDIGRATKQDIKVEKRKADFNSWDEPTKAEIDSVCFSYRHDFGLLDEDDKELTRWMAKEWLHAWRKGMNE